MHGTRGGDRHSYTINGIVMLAAVARLIFAPAPLVLPGLLGLLITSPVVLAAVPHNVLVVYSNSRLLPAIIEGERGLLEGLAARPDLPVVVSTEFLDQPVFSVEAFQRTFVTYLRDKYVARPPRVIITGGSEALDFMLRHRTELFVGVPIVHMSVTADHLRSIAPLPADVVGTPITYDFNGTVAQALRWHPDVTRLVVVTGTSPWDLEWETRLRHEAADLPRVLSIEFLAGLPVDELLERLRHLAADAIVFTPGFFRDGSGREFSPREVTRLIATAAPAPVYGPFSTAIGTGIVGGRIASYREMGSLGAETAIALIEGATPASLTLPASMPTPLQVDWRQLQRWGISPHAVPADAIQWFREPTLWEAYRNQVLLGVVVMMLQAGLIVALLFERRRRRRTVAALARSEEHMKLAARAAGLSTWILDDAAAAAAATDVQTVANGPVSPHGLLVDFREILARIEPQDRATVSAALRDAVDTDREFDVEYRVLAPDGELHWQAARGRAEHAQASRLLGVAIDITQRKRAEIQAEQDRAALYHMTRVSLLGQLSASIAHQLRQPLASIMGNAEAAQKMLEREVLDVDELREICADIVADDHRAAQVILRLGALFKRGEPLFEPLDISELVRDTLEFTGSVLTTRNVELVTRLGQGLPPVAGDRVQLQQLLLNLIVNGSDAMAELEANARVLTISTEAHAATVTVCVVDRGPGVADEAFNKVFEPFWTTKTGGMGMGLAICRSIAEAHRGSLRVANPPGGGAAFCLTLPAAVVP
jgi:C4-dicarboxylate-specific signal transduction histidine kinase